MTTLRRLVLICCLNATFLAADSAVRAGVILDGTAGPAKSLTGPAFVLNAADGKQVGTNLFHSFSALSLAPSESLTFTGPPATTAIVARVTGGSPSQMDGTIATSGMPAAHLFLINPAGISFGPAATVAVAQSFTATSANTVRLSDGTSVSSTGPLPALLTSAPPAAFGFTSPSKGTIAVQGATLAVPTGKSLALISSTVQITQGTTLRATNGRVQLVAVGDAGTAQVDAVNGGTTSLSAPPSAGPLTIDATSRLTADGAGTGRIDLLGQQINLEGTVTARTEGNRSGADIHLFAVQNCTIDGGQLSTRSSTPSAAGPISLQVGGLLTISRGGLISANTTLIGAGGLITLVAHDLLIDGASSPSPTGVTAQSQFSGTGGAGGDIGIQTHTLTVHGGGTVSTVTFGGGNAGNITINTDSLALAGGGQVLAQTAGSGSGGAIRVNASAGVEITGIANVATGLIADTTAGSTGNGGQIQVHCQTLNVLPLGVISTTSNGAGVGGGISVAAGSIRLDGGNQTAFTGLGANSQSTDLAAGAGGNVQVTAAGIEILNGAGIAANTFGPGNGGDISITAPRQLLIDGGGVNPVATGVFAKSLNTGLSGDGGAITVQAHELLVTRGGSINSATDGTGNGGNIVIDGTTALINLHGQISASGTGGGKAGDIRLADAQIQVNGGSVAASASGDGLGGSVRLTASGNVAGTHASISVAADHASGGDVAVSAKSILLSGSTITAQAYQDGGSIFLTALDRTILSHCILNAKAGNNGGSIHLDPTYVVLRASDLTADAIRGNGGSIFIHALWYLPSTDSVLSVSSEFGVAGNIAIETPNPLVTSSIAPLQVQMPGLERLLMDSCEVRFRTNASSLLVMPTYNPSALPPLWLPVQTLFPAPQGPGAAPAGDPK